MPKVKTIVAEPLPLTAAERAQSLAASREVVLARAENRPGLPHRRLDEKRWAAFIAAVRECGNLKFAAARADGDRAWATASTYAVAMRSDPLREREYQGAIDFWHSRIAQEIHRRAIEGVDVPKFDKDGQVIAYLKEYDSNLTRLMASEHLKWIEKRTDSTTHTDAPIDDSIFTLSADALLRMDSDTRDHLRQVLLWVRADRAQDAGDAIEIEQDDDAALIEHDDPGDLSAEDREALKEIFA